MTTRILVNPTVQRLNSIKPNYSAKPKPKKSSDKKRRLKKHSKTG
jgi:hypothetical protein